MLRGVGVSVVLITHSVVTHSVGWVNRGVTRRKQAFLMEFGPKYQRFDHYQDGNVGNRNFVLGHVIAHLSNYRARAAVFTVDFERHSATRRRRSGAERLKTAGK